jgi:hypothetical protein
MLMYILSPFLFINHDMTWHGLLIKLHFDSSFFLYYVVYNYKFVVIVEYI